MSIATLSFACPSIEAINAGCTLRIHSKKLVPALVFLRGWADEQVKFEKKIKKNNHKTASRVFAAAVCTFYGFFLSVKP